LSEHGFPIADHEARGFLGKLVQQSADGILVISRQGVVRYANPAAEDLFSHQQEPLIGTHLGAPAVEEASRLSLPGEGQLRMVEIKASKIEWRGEQAYLASLRDITQQMELVKSLRSREKLLLETGSMARVGGWEIDLDSGQVWWSAITRKIHQTPPDYVPDLDDALDFFPKHARDRLSRALEQVRERPGRYDLVLPFTSAQGRELWVQAIGESVFEDGECVRLHGTFQDVTDQIEIEQQLQESEQRYKNLYHSIRDAILIANPDREIIDCNAAFEDLFGYALNDIAGRPTQIVYESQQQFQELGQKIQEQEGEGKDFIYTVNYRKKNGEVFPGETSVFFLKDEKGNPEALVGLIRDVSQRAQAEKERQEIRHRMLSLKEIEQAIGSTLDLDEVLELLSSELRKLVQYDSMTVQRLNGNQLQIISAYGFDHPKRVLHVHFPLDPQLPNFEVIENRQPVAYEDIVQAYPQFKEEFTGYQAGTIRSWLGVPLISQDRVLGMMTIDRQERKPYGSEEIRVVSEFANQAAIAIRNAELYEQSIQQIRRLESLRRIDQAITSSLNIDVSLSIFLDQVRESLDVDAAAVLLYEPELQELRFAKGKGFRSDLLQYTSLRLGEGFAGRVGLEGESRFVPDLRQVGEHGLPSDRLRQEGFVSYYALPMQTKGELVGVLEILHRSRLDPDRDWKEFAHTLAQQGAIAVDSVSMINQLQRSNLELMMAYDSTIEGWAHTLEMRDVETEDHSRRVVDLTMRLAQDLGIAQEALAHVRRGALLHDIGKMGIPDEILHKPGPLTDEEWEVMHRHPLMAVEALDSIDFLAPALEIPHYHHERWDGSGYPEGLAGEEIPLAARIFAVVDVWDALRSDRPYREAWEDERALDYIQEQAGKAFDPRVVKAFLNAVGEGSDRAAQARS